MKKYFHTVDIKDNDANVNTVSRYFTDFTLLRWRCRSIDESCGQATIRT
ncbi:hypothetical protein Goarm_005769 [Gossypium armourianum]|uniref:Uncharacterized protein n=1 Tax=Gossypium armourianum TaxID=34283 RepID=A0A7J9KE09_9ROSI|nr:hypothetical protein [Gossypium armourianum]